MYMVFIDESGFDFKWEETIEEKPFYVLAAVAIPMENLPEVYKNIRSSLEDLHIPGLDAKMIGIGQEIKAKDVDSGSGYWRNNKEHRDKVRDLFLGVVKKHSGTAFVITVDKQAHLDRYVSPIDPDKLSLQFLLERVQGFLVDQNSYAVCTFDKTSREKILLEHAEELIKHGSTVVYWSNFYGTFVEKNIELSRILEFHMQDSKNSLGLQIADFFARYTYSWRKKGKDHTYPGWVLIEESLYRRAGTINGYGYKEFPEGTIDEADDVGSF